MAVITSELMDIPFAHAYALNVGGQTLVKVGHIGRLSSGVRHEASDGVVNVGCSRTRLYQCG